MSKIANPTKVITGVNTRWSYANVWDPKSINGAAPKYSVSLIIPKSDTVTVNKIKAAIQAAYEEGESKLKGTAKVSGDVVTNTEAAKRYSRFAVGQDAIPLAPHLLLPLYMKEESERELAMFMDMVLLGRCDELWVFGGEASAGMCAEIAKAKRHGKKIRYFDSLCNETNRALEIGPERLQEER